MALYSFTSLRFCHPVEKENVIPSSARSSHLTHWISAAHHLDPNASGERIPYHRNSQRHPLSYIRTLSSPDADAPTQRSPGTPFHRLMINDFPRK
jgi:hypothetical protein